MHVTNLKEGFSKDEIQWSGKVETTESGLRITPAKEGLGYFDFDGKRYSITHTDFDEKVRNNAVSEKIVSDYEGRIKELKAKVAVLNSEIVKS